jgi:hypothetical protein
MPGESPTRVAPPTGGYASMLVVYHSPARGRAGIKVGLARAVGSDHIDIGTVSRIVIARRIGGC